MSLKTKKNVPQTMSSAGRAERTPLMPNNMPRLKLSLFRATQFIVSRL